MAALAEAEDLRRAGLAGHVIPSSGSLEADGGAVIVDDRGHRVADELKMVRVDVEAGMRLRRLAISRRG